MELAAGALAAVGVVAAAAKGLAQNADVIADSTKKIAKYQSREGGKSAAADHVLRKGGDGNGPVFDFGTKYRAVHCVLSLFVA